MRTRIQNGRQFCRVGGKGFARFQLASWARCPHNDAAFLWNQNIAEVMLGFMAVEYREDT